MRFVLVLSCLLVSIAHAQMVVLPTDVDLKTAYCLRVKQNQSQIINSLANAEPQSSALHQRLKKAARDDNNDVNRLQSYLIPRLPTLEFDGIQAAVNRANADINEASSDGDACTAQCRQFGDGQKIDERWASCHESCSAQSAAILRLRKCRNVDWLPY